MLKRLFSTSTVKMANIPPLTTLVQNSMQKLYPLALADRSWDNVGLLLEPPYPRERMSILLPKVLLTIDLTTPVVMEALTSTNAVETIVTYHPIIFRGLKALTMEDPQQKSLLRLCAAGIGVYSPHTSLDSAVGGINDWLASIIALKVKPEVSAIVPCAGVEGHERGGHGRIVTLQSEITLEILIKRIKAGLNLKYVQLAKAPGSDSVRSIAICAGSGSSVFKELTKDVDVLFTGELSHHDVLAAVAKGRHVILCGHTNTERGFLNILQKQLQSDLDDQVGPDKVCVDISRYDQDPIEII